MALGANTYGTVEGVAAYVPMYTNGGAFDSTTNPALTTVESWLDQVSAIANTAIADNGFVVPVTQEDALLSLSGVINQHVADLCHASHGTGRFMTDRALSFGMSPMNVIRQELLKWIGDNSDGFIALGVETAETEDRRYEIVDYSDCE